MSARRCPDCTAVTRRADNVLEHDRGCPVGTDLEAVVEGDRRWFEDHPGASAYRRRPSWGEAVTLNVAIRLPVDTRWHGRVLVLQIEPGVRLRCFEDCHSLVPVAALLGGAR